MTFMGLTQNQVNSINDHSIEYLPSKNLLMTILTVVQNPLITYLRNQAIF